MLAFTPLKNSLLLGITIIGMSTLFFIKPIAQNPNYHLFADQRTLTRGDPRPTARRALRSRVAAAVPAPPVPPARSADASPTCRKKRRRTGPAETLLRHHP